MKEIHVTYEMKDDVLMMMEYRVRNEFLSWIYIIIEMYALTNIQWHVLSERY